MIRYRQRGVLTMNREVELRFRQQRAFSGIPVVPNDITLCTPHDRKCVIKLYSIYPMKLIYWMSITYSIYRHWTREICAVKNKYTNSYLCYLFNRGSSDAVDTLLVVTVLRFVRWKVSPHICIVVKLVTTLIYHINLDNFRRLILAREWGICV